MSNHTNSSQSPEMEANPVLKFVVEGIAIPIFGAIGVLGNLLCLFILKKPSLELKTIYKHLMVSRLLWDTTVILLAFFLYSLYYLNTAYNERLIPSLTPFLYPMIMMAQHGSVYTTVAMAVERYLNTFHPHKYLPPRSGKIASVLILMAALVFNLPLFFELKTVQLDSENNTSYLSVQPTKLRVSHAYITANMIKVLALLNLPSISLLGFLNYKTYKIVSEKMKVFNSLSNRKKRDVSTSKGWVFCIIGSISIVCISMKMVLNVIEFINGLVKPIIIDNNSMENISIISNFLIILYSSSNFIVYFIYDERQVLSQSSKSVTAPEAIELPVIENNVAVNRIQSREDEPVAGIINTVYINEREDTERNTNQLDCNTDSVVQDKK